MVSLRWLRASPAPLLIAVVVLAVRPASPAVQAGVGTARGAAIPLRLTVGGVSVDLLDIGVSASIDTTRSGGPTASATLTAMSATGPSPRKAGEVSSASARGQRDEQSAADVPLSVPGVMEARLDSALARTEASDEGSSATMGAVLAGLSVSGGLLTVESATASMSVAVTPDGGSVATKTVQIPSVGMLRVADLANIAGVALDALSVGELLSIANELWLAAPGDFGSLLAQEQAVQSQIDTAQAELDAKTAERSAAQSSLSAKRSQLASAESDLADAQAAVTAAEGGVATAQAEMASAQAALDAAEDALVQRATDVSQAQAAVTAAEAAVTSAQALLDEAVATLAAAEADLATAQGLSLLDPGAVATLQALADAYGVSLTVDVLNFAASLASVTAAIQASVDAAALEVASLTAQRSDAQAALTAATGDLAAAQAAFDSAVVARDDARSAASAAQDALAAAVDTLASAQDAVATLSAAIDVLQAEIAALTDAIALLDPAVATLEATIAALRVVLADLVAQLDAFASDLRALVEKAPIVSLEGVTIVMSASADAGASEPTVEVSFAKLHVGDLEVATDVNTVATMDELTEKIERAVNGVGAVVGLAPASISFIDPASESGTDTDGYRFARASFTLLEVAVPLPGGGTLALSVGDPEVFAEFVPAAPVVVGSGTGGGGGSGGGGLSGVLGAGASLLGDADASGSGGPASLDAPNGSSGPALPVTGVASTAALGLALLASAAGIAAFTLRRRRGLGRHH